MRSITLISVALFAACGGDESTSPDTSDTAAADVSDGNIQPDVDADAVPDGVDAEPDTDDSGAGDTGSSDASPDAGSDGADADSNALDAAEDAVSDASPDSVGNPAEDLCWGTGGAWSSGACDCQQDGATTSLGYYFDAVLGCIPDPEILCGATGGIWEDGACQCAQDGASLHFELHPKLGCSMPEDASLVTDIRSLELLALIERYTSADQRVWLIDRPGVFDMVYEMNSFADISDHLPPGWETISAAAGACTTDPARDTWPTVDCDSELGMTPTGCFLATVSDEFDRVSYLMGIGVEYEFADWTPEQIEAARSDESRVIKVFVSSSHGVTLAFRRLAGAWVLVAIDLSRYSCSA
jgi:hypothetical protein